MAHDITVGGLYESVKLEILRFYLVSLGLEESEASLEDLETSDTPSEQQHDDCYITGETYLSSDDEIQFGPVEDPDYTSDDTLSIDALQEEIPSQSRDVTHVVTHQEEIPFQSRDVKHVVTHQEEIPSQSRDVTHVVTHQEEIPSQSRDVTHVVTHQEEIPSQSRDVTHVVTHQDSAPKVLRLHRVNIIHDMIEQFKDASFVETRLSVLFVDECGIDASGVARDAYSSFWEAFFLNCADGETDCAPALRPEYGKEEWEVVGRILLKGYQDHGFFPVKLSLAFAVCLFHGENKVTPDMLIESFLRFFTPFEKDIISSVLEGREYDMDDLLDILSRMGFFSVDTHEESAFVMEGDSVSLHTNVKTNQQEKIRWYFNDVRIAQITGDQSNICTDVQCNNGTERFRDRLKLDNETGSLTIMIIRELDSGLYRLRIISSSSMNENVFIVAVYGVSAAERDKMKKKSVEKESVTLDPAVIKKQNDSMKWYFNDSLIAEITGDQNKICSDDECKDRFRDRLKLNNQTGSLTITNTRTTDSGEYKLENNHSRISIIKIFSLIVTGEYH
ncbi:hypothetical protein cypCar_00035369 [Cyprinus carpio]|nr:hypothetical protein cypCar_00035369 [Cyprinus carpio]